MPKRSKQQRNPRVKHRMKFEKAKKRRKGAVRNSLATFIICCLTNVVPGGGGEKVQWDGGGGLKEKKEKLRKKVGRGKKNRRYSQTISLNVIYFYLISDNACKILIKTITARSTFKC